MAGLVHSHWLPVSVPVVSSKAYPDGVAIAHIATQPHSHTPHMDTRVGTQAGMPTATHNAGRTVDCDTAAGIISNPCLLELA